MRIECPHCATSYPAELAGLDPNLETVFTIRCSVCAGEFDGAILTTPEVEASLLHRITRGWFGIPGQEAGMTVEVRKRVV